MIFLFRKTCRPAFSLLDKVLGLDIEFMCNLLKYEDEIYIKLHERRLQDNSIHPVKRSCLP